MLIKSVSVTFSILRAFVGRRSALTLKEIGYRSGLPCSKAHRYLQSLIREGMVSQDPRTRHYRLGPAAIDLGLEALENTDPVVNACEIVRPLAETLDIAISVSVFGPNGPITIWYEQPITHCPTPARLGGTLPTVSSAAGQVFIAYLPRHLTRPQLFAECHALANKPMDPDAIAFRVRSAGYACVDGRPGTGGASVAAPVLDARGEACAAITFFMRPDDPADVEDAILAALLDAARQASAFKFVPEKPRLARVV